MSTREAVNAVLQTEIDAAQRMADAVNLHVLAVQAEGTGRDQPGYVAIRLEDGRSPDGILYDTRRDACRHHRFNPAICFVKVGRETMPVNEALLVLQMNRMAFKRGVIFSEEEVITTQLPELMRPFIPRTLRGINHG